MFMTRKISWFLVEACNIKFSNREPLMICCLHFEVFAPPPSPSVVYFKQVSHRQQEAGHIHQLPTKGQAHCGPKNNHGRLKVPFLVRKRHDSWFKQISPFQWFETWNRNKHFLKSLAFPPRNFKVDATNLLRVYNAKIYEQLKIGCEIKNMFLGRPGRHLIILV